jgi:hypothetical protein
MGVYYFHLTGRFPCIIQPFTQQSLGFSSGFKDLIPFLSSSFFFLLATLLSLFLLATPFSFLAVMFF